MARLLRAVAVMVGMMLAAAGLAGGQLEDDGLRLVYAEIESSNVAHLVLNKPNGADPKIIHTTQRVTRLACSFDGDEIFFREEPQFQPRIASINSNGSDYQVLTEDDRLYTPILSPDGRYIAFAYDWTDYHQLVVMPFPDLEITFQAPPRFRVGEFSWAPDSSQIAFEAYRLSENNHSSSDIGIFDLTGRNVKWVTDTALNETTPSWSPDGQMIAFTGEAQGQREIYLINLSTEEFIQLTYGGDSWYPNWSPDGTQIAFLHGYRSGNQDVYVMNSDGSNIRRITDSPRTELTPCWLYIRTIYQDS